MSTSSVILPALTGGGSATVLTTGIVTYAGKVLKRIAAEVVRDGTKDIRDDMTELKVQFASETGGNSGGLRQAINELDNKVDAVTLDVAHLKGLAEGQAKAAV